MSEINEGIELDRAVHKAIRHELDFDTYRSLYWPAPPSFAYSTDLNAAFDAAHRVGLFSGDSSRHDQMVLRECESSWLIEDSDGVVVANGGTVALAICEAILSR